MPDNKRKSPTQVAIDQVKEAQESAFDSFRKELKKEIAQELRESLVVVNNLADSAKDALAEHADAYAERFERTLKNRPWVSLGLFLLGKGVGVIVGWLFL